MHKDMHSKTALPITYCLIGHENADTILIMDNSQIVGYNGLYPRPWDLQYQIMVEVENANI